MATAQLQRQLRVYFRKAARVAWTRVALLFSSRRKNRRASVAGSTCKMRCRINPGLCEARTSRPGGNHPGTYPVRHFPLHGNAASLGGL